MKELEKLEEERRAGRAKGIARKKGTASNEMCNLLIINISSLQLIPMTVIGIMPTLIGLMTAVGILRASGCLEFISGVLGMFTEKIGFPGELVRILLLAEQRRLPCRARKRFSIQCRYISCL